MDKGQAVVDGAAAGSTGFLKYVFAFDNEVKCQVGNMLQYGALALLPVLGTLKAVQHLIPEDDPSKGSITLALESLGQVGLVLVLMWLSDRVIRYIPTLSGCAYGEFQPVAFLLPFLIIMATMQTKLGAKLSLIVDRVIGEEEPVHAPVHKQAPRKGHGGIRVTQPLANQPSLPPHQPSQADTLDNRMLVPSDRQLTTMPAPPVPSHVQQQGSPDFQNMYQGPNTPLQDAAVPGGNPPQAQPRLDPAALTEPMAANEALGGSMGSSW